MAGITCCCIWRQRKKQGLWAEVLVRLRKHENRPPLPSILLVNVQSLANKRDELRSRMAFQQDVKNCNVMVFTETWLDPSIPDSAIVSEGVSIHRQDTLNTPFRDGYKALPRPPLGKSDHVSLLLLLSYRQKLKCDRLVTWSDHSDLALCHCFNNNKQQH